MVKVNIYLVVRREERERKIRMKCGREVATAMEQYKQLKTQNRQIWRKATDDR